MPRFKPSDLERFACDILAHGGFNSEEAAVTAESLIGANLRGYDSHGVMRLPSYVDFVAVGEVVSGVDLTILQSGPSRVVADANRGVGQVQARRMLRQLMDRAKEGAVAAGTLRHCGHIGRLGEYCEIAAAEGMVAMLMVNSHGGISRVAPPGGKAPRVSTNPLAIGVPMPADGDRHLILDFSTSATAEGKVRVKKIAGEKCPPGWLLDSDGRPTTDPNTLYGTPPGTILPFGGDQAYKGFGLGLMVELLCGALSGGASAREKPYPFKGNCVFMLVLDPAGFGGAEFFSNEAKQLADYVRGCPRVDGVDAIVLPGDPERARLETLTRDGVEIEPENWAALEKLAQRLNVATPRGL